MLPILLGHAPDIPAKAGWPPRWEDKQKRRASWVSRGVISRCSSNRVTELLNQIEAEYATAKTMRQ
jgi:hypothetical protein